MSISEFCIDSIDETKLKSLSVDYNFELPSNNNLCNLLCNLFYLKLYLELLSSGASIPPDAKTFTDQIWKQVIQNNSKRKGNLPKKRESFIINMALSLLKYETYVYKAQASDDEEVIELLEDQGIITPYNDAPALWVFNHDVYEEIVINHIFDEKYDENQDIQQITEIINESLRSRKMYRIWLERKLRDPDSNLFSSLANALTKTEILQSWKDETIIALMNSENDEAFRIMVALFSANDFELFTRAVFLLNTACKCIVRNEKYFKLVKTYKISTYRFTEPSGKVWHTVFNYISKHITSIPWNKKNLGIVIEAMKSWVINNPSGETTSIVGHIVLFLKNKIWQDSEYKYVLHDDSIYKSINNIILLSAIEIQDELATLVDSIINNKSFSHQDKYYVFLTQSLSSIYECGKVCAAIPEKLLQLAWAYWLYKDDNDHFSSMELESYFGLNDHLLSEYYPASAYQTPMLALLKEEPMKSINFIIDFTNNAATSYKESDLNKNYNECSEIQIVLSDKEHISQICSDRLWKMYRGTHVAPDLLESVLMALEEYILLYIEKQTEKDAIALCLYLLRKSNNVAITAVVLSAVIAYPDKLFNIACILLRTKDLFLLDRSRFLCEHGADFFKGFSPQYKLFDEERIRSNNNEFRKKTFEDIILQYQVNSDNLSDEDFKNRLEKLYTAIENASTDIDKWHPIHQACLYRIDLRKYKKDGEPIVEGKQISIPMKAEMPKQVVEYFKNSRKENSAELDNTEIMLWASLRYKNDEKYRNYKKYEDNPILAFDYVKTLSETEKDDLPLMSIDTIVFTIAILLRDFSSMLKCNQYEYCKNAIIGLGFELIKSNSRLLYNNELKKTIITEISNLTADNSNIVEWTPVSKFLKSKSA